MGIAEFFSDILDSLPWSQEAHAEAPEEGEDKDQDEGKEEGGDSEEKEGGDEEPKEEASEEEGGDNKEEGGEQEDEEEEEEEEEEEDEPVDPKTKLEEDCARSSQCVGYKHHYEECVERVTAQHEDADYKGPKEDCVEEFFHLQHCATQCAAGKLFKLLK